MSNPCRHERLEIEVLEKITPSDDERRIAWRVIEELRALIDNAVLKAGFPVEVSIEGSFAKDTWLSRDLDIDVFLLVRDRSRCSRENLILLKDVLRKAFSDKYIVNEVYADHPYLRVLINDLWVELVPACFISEGEKPITPVDRTPLHRKYVVSQISRIGGFLKNEIRLFKAFLKGIGVYGAEVSVKGFSGYMAELLIIRYKCFRNLLEAVREWSPPVAVTLEPSHEKHIASLRRKYKNSVMIVPDPVDPSRNAAAAVSLKSLSTLIIAARLYLQRPSLEFFGLEPHGLEASVTSVVDRVRDILSSERASRIVLIIGEPSSYTPEDVLYGIGERVARILAKRLSQKGFTIVDYGVFVSQLKVFIFIEALENSLPAYRLLKGPYAWQWSHVERFLAVHSKRISIGPWIANDGRLYAVERVDRKDLKSAVIEELGFLPKSARQFSIEVKSLRELNQNMLDEAFVQWLKTFVLKKPGWLKL